MYVFVFDDDDYDDDDDELNFFEFLLSTAFESARTGTENQQNFHSRKNTAKIYTAKDRKKKKGSWTQDRSKSPPPRPTQDFKTTEKKAQRTN